MLGTYRSHVLSFNNVNFFFVTDQINQNTESDILFFAKRICLPPYRKHCIKRIICPSTHLNIYTITLSTS